MFVEVFVDDGESVEMSREKSSQTRRSPPAPALTAQRGGRACHPPLTKAHIARKRWS